MQPFDEIDRYWIVIHLPWSQYKAGFHSSPAQPALPLDGTLCMPMSTMYRNLLPDLVSHRQRDKQQEPQH
eukprot:6336837-Amphidinium_carterae.1